MYGAADLHHKCKGDAEMIEVIFMYAGIVGMLACLSLMTNDDYLTSGIVSTAIGILLLFDERFPVFFSIVFSVVGIMIIAYTIYGYYQKYNGSEMTQIYTMQMLNKMKLQR